MHNEIRKIEEHKNKEDYAIHRDITKWNKWTFEQRLNDLWSGLKESDNLK